MSFTDRLNLAMKEKNISQGKLAEAIGVAQSGIWKLTSGASKTSRKLVEIARVLEVNAEWLATGSGSMKGNQVSSDFDLSEKRETDEWDSNTPLSSDEVEVPYFTSLELAAGQGGAICEDYNKHKLRFGKSFFRRKGTQKENVICFPVRGHSMDPLIPHGATVAVDTGKKEIIDGDVYAICQGDLYRVKRLYRMPNNKIRINSFNSIDNPDEYDEKENVQVIGRVFHYSAEI